MEKIFKKPIVVFFAAMLSCALWGSATPSIKVGYELMLPDKGVASTILFAGMRFFLAGILTILIYCIARRKFLFPRRENVGKVATVALFQTILQYLFFYIGVANTTSVKSTILTGANSFFCILIASLVFRQEKLTARKLLACLLGFVGIVLVNLNGLDLNMTLTGEGFVLMSSMVYGVSSALIKKYSKFEDPVVISGYQFAMGGLVMIILGFALGGHIKVETMAALGTLLYLALVSAVAYSLWGVLLKYNPVSKVTIYTFMIPVFGVLISNILLTEQGGVTADKIVIALVLIAAGIGLLNYSKDKN